MFQLHIPRHIGQNHRTSKGNVRQHSQNTIDISLDIKYHLKYTLYYNTLMPLRQRLSDHLSGIPQPASPLEISLLFRVRSRADLDTVPHALDPPLVAAVDEHLNIVSRLRSAGEVEGGEVSDEAFHASAALLGNLGRVQDEVTKINGGREVLEGWTGKDTRDCLSFVMWKADIERAVKAYTKTLKSGVWRGSVMSSAVNDSRQMYEDLLKILDRDEPGVLWCELPWLRELCMLKPSWTKRLSRKVKVKFARVFDGGESPEYQRLSEES